MAEIWTVSKALESILVVFATKLEVSIEFIMDTVITEFTKEPQRFLTVLMQQLALMSALF